MANQGRNLRFAIYTHDTFGLGHVRRCLHLTRSLAEAEPESAILFITGSPALHAMDALPGNADFLKIAETYRAVFIDGVRELRQEEGNAARRFINLVDNLYDKKVRLVKEANRVLKPGGKLVFGEFHKPRLKLLEWAGRAYFKIFEPYATEMWDSFDFTKVLDEETGSQFHIDKDTFLFDNFQVLTAKRLA